jgi:hypothetical protein
VPDNATSHRAAKLRINPDPIKMVPAAERDVWTRQPGWRCDHEDGRGRCSSRDTKAFPIWEDGAYLRVDHLCSKHAHEGRP